MVDKFALQAAHDNGRIWPLMFVIVAWAGIFCLSILSYRPVQPRPESIPADQFSAARADKHLEQLIGDSIPHPAGSKQNEVVRKRIIAMLESFGYSVQVQSGIGTVARQVKHRSPDRDQVELHNIIAVRKAKRSGGLPVKKPVMLVSHYDSVPTGPGASDDGVATAVVLEIARIWSNEPTPDRDLVFLITDGEEFGLLGAKLFVDDHPLAKEIGIAINLEARGTTGPSCMFETSRWSRALIPVYARAADKKFASSLFVEIYRRMPRDTDFSVFKRAGMLGYNFAFIGDVRNYHTSADNYSNVDLASVQHHGDNAMGLLREILGSTELELPDLTNLDSNDEAVYFDLFGKWIVWWPAGWSVWITIILLIVLAIVLRYSFRHSTSARVPGKTATSASIAWHVAVQVLTIASVFLAGYMIQKAVRLDENLAHPWPLNPIPQLIGHWLLGLAVVGGIAIAVSRRTEARFYLTSFCILWLTFSLLTSILVVGASHLFLVPMLMTTAILLLTLWFWPTGMQFCLVVAAISVGIIWIPLGPIFYDAVGFRMPVVMMARISIVSSSLLGLLALASDRSKFWFTMLSSSLSVATFVVAVAISG